jgi:aryl-alcohol dehydrogenase-like predicted oxidoreductase
MNVPLWIESRSRAARALARRAGIVSVRPAWRGRWLKSPQQDGFLRTGPVNPWPVRHKERILRHRCLKLPEGETALISRREFLGTSLGAAAALGFTPELLHALQQSGGQLIQRAIPSSGEMLPVIGVQFGNSNSLDPAALKEVLKTLLDNGGRFLDTMHQSVPGVEDLTAKVVTELGVQSKVFLALRALPSGPPQPGPDTPKKKVEALLASFKVAKIDLLQLPVQADPAQFPVLQEMKKDGRIRYVAATVITKSFYPQLESIMRNEPIDFIGVDYSLDNRSAEEKILPLAQERKIGVVAYFPFTTGTLFQRVSAMPLPDWAAEFGAKTWAQFFLKFVVSHPAVTVVRAGTTQAKHMLENIGGGIGRLPDEATRKRMAVLADGFPGRPFLK